MSQETKKDISLSPLDFSEAVTDLLKVKPPPKGKTLPNKKGTLQTGIANRQRKKLGEKS